MHENDTIVAPATPTGQSALAIVRVSGPQAGRLGEWFHRSHPPLPRMAWHGDYTAVDGSVIDDGVFCFFAGPKSYTGEDVLEISCHGNPFIVSKIVEDLTRRGCRLAEPGEFTKRAFLRGRLDLTEAEAVMDLIRARSDRALAAAQRQLRGALRQRIEDAVSRLLDFCAAVEAQVDFPEEDLPAADRRAWQQRAAEFARDFRALAATRREGDLLREGVRVALWGEPNAGKSSLLNRLVGFERAIVSEDPGTTRDFLEERIVLGGYCIRLFDTAGVREADAPVERAGVQRTLERMREADVLVWVADIGRPAPRFPPDVLPLLVGRPVLLALNKCDRPGRGFCLPDGVRATAVEVSAVSGAGVGELQRELQAILERTFDDPAEQDGVVVNARHEQCLVEAAQCLERVDALLGSDRTTDLVAIEIRSAVEALGIVVGRIDHDVILDRLFASFCIGK